jgi:hypothetical protein
MNEKNREKSILRNTKKAGNIGLAQLAMVVVITTIMVLQNAVPVMELVKKNINLLHKELQELITINKCKKRKI